jgi:hypothetical protein
MGLERPCTAIIGGRRIDGVAHLEPAELRFSASPPLRIPLATDVRAEAKNGRLEVAWPGGAAAFELGKDAETWALRIRYPRGRLDKLGIKPESIVSVLGIDDETFGEELASRASDVTSGRVRKGSHLLVARVRTLADLDRLTTWRAGIAEDGAIWAVWTKGQKALTETHVRDAAKAQGLVDVKVMSFSPELSALKLVIPVAQRAKKAAATRTAGRAIRKKN